MVRRICEADFLRLEEWFKGRGVAMPHRSLFPLNGYIVEGIAAGFLYLTDGGIGLLDCYITNPETDSKTRSNALDALTEALLSCAHLNRCRLIKCTTKIEAIKKRAERFGFKSVGTFEAFFMEL